MERGRGRRDGFRRRRRAEPVGRGRGRASPSESSTREGADPARDKSTMRTKAVVRLLPPGLSESEFSDAVGKSVLDRTDFFVFNQGKPSKGISSVAYLNFEDHVHLVSFFEGFHGHEFVDDNGNLYRCSVEIAPFQRVPRNRDFRDSKIGTIETDPAFISFQESLEQSNGTSMPSAELQLERKEAEGAESPIYVSPLILELREKRQVRERRLEQRKENRRLRREAETIRRVKGGSGSQNRSPAPPGRHLALNSQGSGRGSNQAGIGRDSGTKRRRRLGRSGGSEGTTPHAPSSSLDEART